MSVDFDTAAYPADPVDTADFKEPEVVVPRPMVVPKPKLEAPMAVPVVPVPAAHEGILDRRLIVDALDAKLAHAATLHKLLDMQIETGRELGCKTEDAIRLHTELRLTRLRAGTTAVRLKSSRTVPSKVVDQVRMVLTEIEQLEAAVSDMPANIWIP
jgi:hypothetical protein